MSEQPNHAGGNGLDLAAIRPSQSGKYSPNLYRWLTNRERRHRAWTSRVFRDHQGVMWIGMFDLGDFIGARLYGVLCNGAREGSAWQVGVRGLVEVADFWSRYVSGGRCAIDTKHERHFIGDDKRWAVNGDTRECLWCGCVTQSLHLWTEVIERQEWRNADALTSDKCPSREDAGS